MTTIIDQYNDHDADKVATQFFAHAYHDRGMLKWQGFFLSDHTAALQQHRQLLRHRNSVPQQLQSVSKISQELNAAWKSHQAVTIVLNLVDSDHQLRTISKQVMGTYSNAVIIRGQNKRDHLVHLTMIRSVFITDNNQLFSA